MRVIAGVQEVTLGLAERRVAGGIAAGPGRGPGRGLQQGAAVKVGRVAELAGPFGGGGVQPGADDPAWVSASQVSRSSGQAVSTASWLSSTVPAARVSSRSAAKASSTASISRAPAGLLPAVSSARLTRSAVSAPSLLLASAG